MKGGNKNTIKSRIGKKNAQNGSNKKVGDAREKLMQKKRNIKDARERLGQIAHQMDARVKLNRNKINTNPQSVASRIGINGQNGIRVTKTVKNNKGNNQRQKPAITLKRTISGIQTNSSGKGNLRRNVNNSLKNNINAFKTQQKQERQYPLSSPNVITIKNQLANKRRPIQRGPMKVKMNQQKPKANFAPRRNMSSNTSKNPSKFRQDRRRNSQRGTLAINPLLLQAPSTANMNVWSPNPSVPVMNPIHMPMNQTKLKITTVNDYMAHGNSMDGRFDSYSPSNWDMHSSSGNRKRSRPSYDEYVPSSPRKLMSMDVMARLDHSQRHRPLGYKLMISNLHPIVTTDDVQELFRTIGPLHSSRMVQNGLAEVVFVHEKDAYRAIDIYDKRQLDGQPMCVQFYDDSREGGYGGNTNRSSSSSILRYASGGNGFLGDESQFIGSTPSFSRSRHQQPEYDSSPNLSAIHHALFSQRYIPMPSSGNLSRGSPKYSVRRNRY